MNKVFSSSSTSNDEDENGYLFAMELSTISTLPLVIKMAIELELFEKMAKANKIISSAELASLLPTNNNPNASIAIERILKLLASYSVLTSTHETVTSINGDSETRILYGLRPVCKYFMKNEDGVSLASHLISRQSADYINSWRYAKEAILEGGISFEMEFGTNFFDFLSNIKSFNDVMQNITSLAMKKILEKYKGFEGLRELVDVGGGFGANLSLVVSKYPQIKGINFDLPLVIKDAPLIPGVEHVGGNMFQSIPKGEVIFMKWILHDWNDEQCLKILKNSYESLLETGKVIVIEYVAKEFPEIDILSRNIFKSDMDMWAATPGKERTLKEFENLGREAGFAAIKLVCSALGLSVIEFNKKI